MNYTLNKQDYKITGIDNGDVVAYLGIRFATAKRFEKPLLYPLRKELSALKPGDACPQERQFFDESKSKGKMDIFYYREFREGMNFTYSEDCLNLNLFAPKSGDKLPVVINIHGGGFSTCSSDERPFDGSELAQEGVICVCPNYRHNVFGYNALEGGQNLAFYDMICAIKWVKENIAVFGGDPDNITLMGQSAGAISIQNLVLLPEIKSLVKGAIMLSGGASVRGIFAPKSLWLSKRFFLRVRKELAKQGKTPQNASYEELFLAWCKHKRKDFALSMLGTMPVFDGEIVKKDLYKSAYKDKQIPCIVSVTKDDLLEGYLHKIAAKMRKKSEKTGSKTWELHFYHDLPGDDMGAWHSADLWYIFGLKQHPWRVWQDRDVEVSTELKKRFCEFARTQNPNPQGYEKWEPWQVLEIR